MKYITRVSIILSIFLISCKANFQQLQGVDDKNNLTTVDQLQDNEYSNRIELLYIQGIEGYFVGKDSIEIYYKIFKQASENKGAVLISSGRTEAAIKYKEVIFDLYNNGYTIYILDHRGQGLSGRLVEDHDMGYIDEFQYYIDDMKYFYDNFVKPNNHLKKYLLAHSLGGAIGMTYIEQNPNDFNAAAFSSPMLGLTHPICSAVKILVDKEPKYAVGETTYHDDKVAFKDNKLTGCEIRYNRMIDAFDKVPKAKLGGASYQWIYKSCLQFNYIFKHVNNINTPFILFSGTADQIVDIHAHQVFIDKARKNNKLCKSYIVEGAGHELLIEKDEYRTSVLDETLDFFNKF